MDKLIKAKKALLDLYDISNQQEKEDMIGALLSIEVRIENLSK